MDEASQMKCHMKKIDFGQDDLLQDGFGMRSLVTSFSGSDRMVANKKIIWAMSWENLF